MLQPDKGLDQQVVSGFRTHLSLERPASMSINSRGVNDQRVADSFYCTCDSLAFKMCPPLEGKIFGVPVTPE